MKQAYKFVDLFCGAGGFSLGFVETGRYTPVLSIDNFRPAAETYKANFPESLVLNEDIKDVDSATLSRFLREKEIDVVIGSPPCEPFTGANPQRKKDPLDRLYADPQGQLTLHFIKLVGLIRPRIFVMENVPAIMDGGLKEALKAEFEKVGYEKIYFNVLSAEDYGTPSRRRRVFISNVEIKPKPAKKVVKVSEALSGLPEPNSGFPNHETAPLSLRKIKKISRLRPGMAMIYFRGAEREIPNLIRLDPESVAPTVLGSSRFVHPYENRLLTVREQARLMGFPDYFVFYGGRDEQYNMIGEAVPPPLAKAIALYLLEILDSEG